MNDPPSVVKWIREALAHSNKSHSIVEVGKNRWEQVIRQCHDPLFENYFGKPDLYKPKFEVQGAYDYGEVGNIDYSFIGDWTEPCFWFTYHDDERFKIWVFEGQLSDIVDCLYNIPPIDSTVATKKLRRCIVNIRQGVSYCGEDALDTGIPAVRVGSA